jgi:hypoxanthine phosphoribosyltransferase
MTPELVETTYDGITYVCPTWEQMGIYTFDLARKILESGRKFDKMVPLAKGGLTWARTLLDYLNMDNLNSMRIKKYKGVNQSGVPQIVQPLSEPANGLKVLVFDEVIDSGDTQKLAKRYLEVMGVAELGIAALCLKPISDGKPDYWAFETTGWVVFPHERREFIEESYLVWRAAGLPNREIKNRLVTIGLPDEQVDFFVNRLKLEQGKSRR